MQVLVIQMIFDLNFPSLHCKQISALRTLKMNLI
jgi:hypothetical protein